MFLFFYFMFLYHNNFLYVSNNYIYNFYLTIYIYALLSIILNKVIFPIIIVHTLPSTVNSIGGLKRAMIRLSNGSRSSGASNSAQELVDCLNGLIVDDDESLNRREICFFRVANPERNRLTSFNRNSMSFLTVETMYQLQLIPEPTPVTSEILKKMKIQNWLKFANF